MRLFENTDGMDVEEPERRPPSPSYVPDVEPTLD
jgi:hypothetical protein